MSTTAERLAPFSNEPIKAYTDPADVAAMQAALASVKAGFGKKYPLIIDGERVFTEKTIPSLNPSNPNDVVGDVSSASLHRRAARSRSRTSASQRGRIPPRKSAPVCSSKRPNSRGSAGITSTR